MLILFITIFIKKCVCKLSSRKASDAPGPQYDIYSSKQLVSEDKENSDKCSDSWKIASLAKEHLYHCLIHQGIHQERVLDFIGEEEGFMSKGFVFFLIRDRKEGIIEQVSVVEVWKMRARLFHKDCEVELGSNTFLRYDKEQCLCCLFYM